MNFFQQKKQQTNDKIDLQQRQQKQKIIKIKLISNLYIQKEESANKIKKNIFFL